MKTTNPLVHEASRTRAAMSLIAAAAGMILMLAGNAAHAAPPAGTVIGNQATATYNDAGGSPRTATSNLVTTTVSQVKSFTLAANGARTAAPGQTVYYPHTITNTGNGTDTYALNALVSSNFAGAAAPHGSLAYYIDANGDGVPDNATAITTSGPIAAGGIFRFVVAGTVPGAAGSGDTATITVSVSDTTPTTSNNTDTTTVANSVISVTKALSVTLGPSPSAAPITVTLSYTNSGTAAASTLQLTDTLPAGMTYVAGSGRWSVSGATPLTDANDALEQGGTFPPGIDYRASGGVITATIPSVPAGVSGNVTFQVNVNSNLPPQVITNTAQYQTVTQVPASNTNPAAYTVQQTAAVVANGSGTSSVNNGPSEPVTKASAAAGSTFTFDNFIWNRGNGSDTFDVTIVANNFPAGSTVTLLQQDGVTSLINSAGSAAPDTGPIPGAGQACAAPFVTDGTYCGYKVVARVTLPSNASGGPYTITKRATSVFNNTVSDDVNDTLTIVAANTVDVTNDARTDSTPPGGASAGNAATSGFGGTTTTVVTTNTLAPSTSGTTATRFKVVVNNTGFVSDSFNLSESFAATTAAGVTAPTLPAGWSVVFRADGGSGNCSTVGGTVTNTGAIAAAANKLFCAEVTIPSTTSGQAIPGNYDFDVVGTSATNGAVTDSMRVRVTLTVARSITITPNNVQQTFPGGSVTYTHTITNSGNATDTANFTAGCLSDSRSAQGWNSTAYIDANANGTLEVGTDILVNCGSTSLTLNVGESRTMFVRVFAPGSATGADPANVTTLTATFGASTTFATDSTSVTDGLVLTKDQVAVSCAAAGPHAGYTTAPIAAGPSTAPGQCIAYRITGTNSTAGTITSVVISDIVPANTKMHYACSGNGASTPTVTVGSMAAGSAADNATGTVIANVGPLTSTQSAILYFCVRIDP
jgi:uncharacterized repeat protein (TIGR01451 family)